MLRCDGKAPESVLARYFDPKLGRFLTQDSFLGSHDNPPSLHRYLYGYANPLRYVDPTGHEAESTNPTVSEETLQQWEEYAKVNPQMQESSAGASDSTAPRAETIFEEADPSFWERFKQAPIDTTTSWLGDMAGAVLKKALAPSEEGFFEQQERAYAEASPQEERERVGVDVAPDIAGGFQEAVADSGERITEEVSKEAIYALGTKGLGRGLSSGARPLHRQRSQNGLGALSRRAVLSSDRSAKRLVAHVERSLRQAGAVPRQAEARV